MRTDLLEIQAREKLGMPAEWKVYQWQCMPPTSEPCIYVRVVGAVAPLKRNGFPNWRKRDKATDKEAAITIEAHKAWCKEWSAKTGNCSACAGEGKLMVRCGVNIQTEYRPCPDCQGTGKSI